MIGLTVYFILLLVLLYIAVIYNSSALIFLAGAGFILSLFLAVILLVQTLSLKLSVKSDKRFYEADEEIKLYLKLSNKSFLPIRRAAVKILMKNRMSGETKKQRIKSPLPEKSSVLPVPAGTLSCGIWDISCKKVIIYDLLCWFRMRKRKKVRCEVIQLPKSHVLALTLKRTESALDQQPEEEVSSFGRTDPSNVTGIREYLPQDRLKDIHWKLSFRKDQLLVKEYGQLPQDTPVLLLDTEEAGETVMELIYSFLICCLEKKYRPVLIWNRKQDRQPMVYPVQKEEELFDIMEMLMRQGILRWNPFAPVQAEHLLVIRESKLYQNEEEIMDLSAEDSMARLMKMELIL